MAAKSIGKMDRYQIEQVLLTIVFTVLYQRKLKTNTLIVFYAMGFKNTTPFRLVTL